MTIEKLKNSYVNQLKSLREVYKGLLDDVKSMEVSNEPVSVMGSIITLALVDNLDISQTDVAAAIKDCSFDKVREAIKNDMVSQVAVKIDEIDKLIESV